MSVFQQLQEAGPGTRWLAGAGEYHGGSVTAAAFRLRASIPGGGRGRVALRQPDNFRAALWLTALDGWSESILLLPATLDGAMSEEFMTAAGCDTVIADDPLPKLEDCEPVILAGPPVETRWIIPTSGTTGTPKLVSHTFATLTRSAQKDKVRGAGYRWGLLYDITRFAGLQVFLQAVCGGSALVFPDTHDELGAQLEFLAGRGCNALSATPTLWRKMLMLPNASSLKLLSISMGGEIADRRVLEAVATVWPEAKIRHIYASTEAGVGFSVGDGRPGFPETYLSEPPPGVELRVDAGGMLWLRPAMRGQSYLTGGVELSAEDGWIMSGDIVRREEGRVFFCGRENGAINVGGNKVFPQEIEAVILGVPGVAAALVCGRPNPVMGQLVEVQVVAEPAVDQADLRQRVLAQCRARLERWQVPALVKFVESIATTAAGKAVRN